MTAVESPLVTAYDQSLATPNRLERIRDHSTVSVVSSTDHDEKVSVQWRPSNLGTLKEDPQRQLTVLGIVGLCYFSVCGGPIGSEPIISAGGPLIGLIMLLVFPIILGLPIAYVTAELSTAYPEDGGYTVWVLNAFGPFWGFQTGIDSLMQVLRIRTKYHCDCKAFYVSGWLCSHILATLKLLDGFNLKVLLSSIPARKPPGRPRKVPKARQHDTPNTGQFAVPKLLEKLARRPGFPTNWKVLVPLDINDDDGITTKNFDGIVRPWFTKDGQYYWKIEFADADIDVEPYDIQELAHVLNHTARSGYAFV